MTRPGHWRYRSYRGAVAPCRPDPAKTSSPCPTPAPQVGSHFPSCLAANKLLIVNTVDNALANIPTFEANIKDGTVFKYAPAHRRPDASHLPSLKRSFVPFVAASNNVFYKNDTSTHIINHNKTECDTRKEDKIQQS